MQQLTDGQIKSGRDGGRVDARQSACGLVAASATD